MDVNSTDLYCIAGTCAFSASGSGSCGASSSRPEGTSAGRTPINRRLRKNLKRSTVRHHTPPLKGKGRQVVSWAHASNAALSSRCNACKQAGLASRAHVIAHLPLCVSADLLRAGRNMYGLGRLAAAWLLLSLRALGAHAQQAHPEAHMHQFPKWMICTLARDQLPFMVEWIEFNRSVDLSCPPNGADFH